MVLTQITPSQPSEDTIVMDVTTKQPIERL